MALTGTSFLQVYVESIITSVITVSSQNSPNHVRGKSRMSCAFGMCAVSLILTAASVLVGLYAFTKDECFEGYFKEDEICFLCSEAVDE
jgi:hypothetical protein